MTYLRARLMRQLVRFRWGSSHQLRAACPVVPTQRPSMATRESMSMRRIVATDPEARAYYLKLMFGTSDDEHAARRTAGVAQSVRRNERQLRFVRDPERTLAVTAAVFVRGIIRNPLGT